MRRWVLQCRMAEGLTPGKGAVDVKCARGQKVSWTTSQASARHAWGKLSKAFDCLKSKHCRVDDFDEGLRCYLLLADLIRMLAFPAGSRTGEPSGRVSQRGAWARRMSSARRPRCGLRPSIDGCEVRSSSAVGAGKRFVLAQAWPSHEAPLRGEPTGSWMRATGPPRPGAPRSDGTERAAGPKSAQALSGRDDRSCASLALFGFLRAPNEMMLGVSSGREDRSV